jgi:hypothetical protein
LPFAEIARIKAKNKKEQGEENITEYTAAHHDEKHEFRLEAWLDSDVSG